MVMIPSEVSSSVHQNRKTEVSLHQSENRMTCKLTGGSSKCEAQAAFLSSLIPVNHALTGSFMGKMTDIEVKDHEYTHFITHSS